jgi:hypothetical protein
MKRVEFEMIEVRRKSDQEFAVVVTQKQKRLNTP